MSRPHFGLARATAHVPATGHDIKQPFDASCSFLWHMSFGQIYPGIRRLVQEGFVSWRRVRPLGLACPLGLAW